MPPMLRARGMLARHGKLNHFTESGEGELPRNFRKAFENPGDEYLVRAARDTGSVLLITNDSKVVSSADRKACAEFYRQMGLRIIRPAGYPD